MASAGGPAVIDVFGAVAHPVRRQIVLELAAGELAVRDIAVTFPVSRPAISQHLRVMLEVGLVTKVRVGRENHYRLRPESLNEIRGWLAMLDSMWATALRRLGRHLKETP
jgi:DNA-binding transcriptional ArsR family regulator